jgi:hypothetical protein
MTAKPKGATCNRLHHAVVGAIYECASGRGCCAGVECVAVVTVNAIDKAARGAVKKKPRACG